MSRTIAEGIEMSSRSAVRRPSTDPYRAVAAQNENPSVGDGSVPGASEDTPLVAISRSGCDVAGVTLYDAGDLLPAW